MRLAPDLSSGRAVSLARAPRWADGRTAARHHQVVGGSFRDRYDGGLRYTGVEVGIGFARW